MQTYDEVPWQRLHPAAILFGLIRIARGNIIPLFFGGFAAIGGSLILLFAIVVFGMLLPAIGTVLHFFNYRFRVEGEHLVIHEGVLAKRTRQIPFKRIHNLNSRESVLARMFKVIRLDVETAGGATAEASFIALSRESAAYIREAVRAGKQAAANENLAPVENPETQEIYRIRPVDILVAGATTNRMGLIAIGIGALFQYSAEMESESMPNWIGVAANWAANFSEASPLRMVLMIAVVFLLTMLLAWLLSIATALIRWHGFTLSHRVGDLHIQTGLFTKREFTIPLDKIQALRCVTSAFRRPWKLLQIEVQTAGFMGAQNSGEGNAREQNLLVPITARKHTSSFVRAVWPETDWDHARWQGVHPYTRFRQFRALMMIPLIPATATHIGLGWFSLSHPSTYAALIGLAAIAFAIAHFTYIQTAYAHEQAFLYIKTGFLGLHFWVIPVSKIQNVMVYQDPFQRLRRLASVRVDTAGGGGKEAEIPNIPVDEAWLLFNRFANASRLPDPRLARQRAPLEEPAAT